jgi:oligopeptide/dipeptide ABC transporter ATP-binding protein
MSALLEARAVTKVFGGGLRGPRMTAVEDFSLAIAGEPPSITALVGESGSGKTTLARLLLGLIDPSEGAVLYKGADIRKLSRADLRSYRRDVQVIFQDPFEAYNPFYKVDHVLETPVLNFRLAGSRREARRMIEETLRAVGLRPEETLGRYPHQLSGGQRQRIMVARALLIRPRVIIADEPVSMVDASLRATILTSLRELHDKFGISLIYITHDLTTAYQVSQNVIVLYRGHIAEAGDVEKVVGDPKHPYTRLLIGSIPYPDPNRVWKGEDAPSAEGAGVSEHGCLFAPRCPAAMAVCRESAPPMFRTDRYRAAACFLYRDGDVVPGADIGAVMIPSDDAGLTRAPADEAAEVRPGV